MTEAELKIIRRAYAMQILAAVNADNPRLEDAYASVHREAFLGSGPWKVGSWFGVYRETPSADPVYLYTDNVVAILPEKKLNNGQPSYHAHLINQADPGEGQHVVHVGTGTGYYTALLAEMVGPKGRVTGIEFEPELAAKAGANLAFYPQVTVVNADGSTAPFDTADVIYVNAGATRPADIWLDRLADGGRLILPLTTSKGFPTEPTSIQAAAMQGMVLRIERRGDDYLAKYVSGVAIFPCAGSRDEDSERALAEALAKGLGRIKEITRLYRHNNVPAEDCWLSAPGWSLAYR